MSSGITNLCLISSDTDVIFPIILMLFGKLIEEINEQ